MEAIIFILNLFLNLQPAPTKRNEHFCTEQTAMPHARERIHKQPAYERESTYRINLHTPKCIQNGACKLHSVEDFSAQFELKSQSVLPFKCLCSTPVHFSDICSFGTCSSARLSAVTSSSRLGLRHTTSAVRRILQSPVAIRNSGGQGHVHSAKALGIKRPSLNAYKLL